MKITKELKRVRSFGMKCEGMHAQIMQAKRLEGEATYGLPPGDPLAVVPVAALPGCPDSWLREEGCYVCKVRPDYGLWFDWTRNNDLNTAILPSVKGMNPITGEKLEGLGLCTYKKKCPVHDVEFAAGSDRFCEKCNYEWPPQNYVCHPNTLWWDGFRQPDGSVRQFFFSEDEKRDIASLVIGKQNTVPAFGFAFYQPKKIRKPERTVTTRLGFTGQTGPTGQSGHSGPSGWATNLADGVPMNSVEFKGGEGPEAVYACSMSPNPAPTDICRGVEEKTSGFLREAVEKKDVSIGAGAKIAQLLLPDNLGLDLWREKTTAVIRIYFVFEEEFKTIVAKGIKDIKGDDEGYLKKLPVG